MAKLAVNSPRDTVPTNLRTEIPFAMVIELCDVLVYVLLRSKCLVRSKKWELFRVSEKN